MGMSRPFTPKLQINLNASISTIGATPESGGVPATEETEYSYYSADVVASSLLTEGDVGILGLRYAVSETTDVYSTNMDMRFPIGRQWRINPRLRVDYREIKTDQSTQWIYTPGIRVQYRPTRRLRLEVEAGKQFSQRDMELTNLDRESYFINLGYQFFY
jgi:maltoporin